MGAHLYRLHGPSTFVKELDLCGCKLRFSSGCSVSSDFGRGCDGDGGARVQGQGVGFPCLSVTVIVQWECLPSQVAGAGALWFRPQMALLPSSVLLYPLPFTGPLVPEEVMVKQGGLVLASSWAARCLRRAAVQIPAIASLAALRCKPSV